MFNKITSSANIREAYSEVLNFFYLENKKYSYRGLDGLSLNDFNLQISDLITLIRDELKSFKEIDPALNIFIPKKNNPEKDREIFIYNIKERVKAQAIYRVILPIFENYFSPRLFSYRPGRSYYRASQLLAKRYRKFFERDYVFTADLSNFSGEIDRSIMINKLEHFIGNKDVLKLLSLFIDNRFYYQGNFFKPDRGLVIGCPIFGLLTNFYLSEIDKKYSPLLQFYLRVGDDLIMLDPDKNKMEKIKDDFFSDIQKLKLKLNFDKISFSMAGDRFSFLGYDFFKGKISLPKNFVARMERDFKKILVYKNYEQDRKILILKKIMNNYLKNFNNLFYTIAKNKPQINDFEQIKIISEFFFRNLTIFLFGEYSHRNRRLLLMALKRNNIKIKSFYKTVLDFHYDRK